MVRHFLNFNLLHSPDLTNVFPCFAKDKHLPGADGALSDARKTVEFFTKSTQATAKLKIAQTNSTQQKHKDLQTPLKLIQDVVTRWWSTFRMLKRLHFLKDVIAGLTASQEVKEDVSFPTQEQWAVLEQVQELLRMPAKFQPLLEGEKCVTGSLQPHALHETLAHFKKTHNLPTTAVPVKHLSKVVMEDLGQRCEPADDTGKVNCVTNLPRGARNRCKALHHCVIHAAFLDPRTKRGLKKIIDGTQHRRLLGDVLELMIAREEKDAAALNDDDDGDEEQNCNAESASNKRRKVASSDFSVFSNLAYGTSDQDDYDNDVAFIASVDIGTKCRDDFARCQKRSVHLDFFDEKSGEANDPLQWWKSIGVANFPIVSKLAKRFLTIPATSAPSERVWSRASNVLTMKRARLNADINACMMFVRENAHLISWHCNENNIDMILPMIEDEEAEDIFKKEV